MIRTMMLAAALALTTAATAPKPPAVELWRIACGDFGPVMLSGDLHSSTAQYREKLVSKGNADQAKTAESFRRFDDMATAEKATVIIQHEPADVAKLPAFPTPAD